jgi:hypothetical protein
VSTRKKLLRVRHKQSFDNKKKIPRYTKLFIIKYYNKNNISRKKLPIKLQYTTSPPIGYIKNRTIKVLSTMMNRSKMPSLVTGAMVLLFSCATVAQQCPSGEQPLEFRFFTDNNSWKDNGWVLECDYEDENRELLWSVPIGSLEFQDRTEVIREAACVPDKATCYLNIFDAKGDGLQGNKNGDPSTNSFAGWFAFLHGATTVATYKNLEDPKFSELTYCVGPKCDQKPQEIQADDADCQEIVYLAMQLDNNPQDTSYQGWCLCRGRNLPTERRLLRVHCR